MASSQQRQRARGGEASRETSDESALAVHVDVLVPICRTVHSAEWSSVLQNGNRVDHSAEWTRPGAGVHTTTTILQIGIAETFLQMGIRIA